MISHYTDYICFQINISLQHRVKFIDGLTILRFVLGFTSITFSSHIENILTSILRTWEKVYTIGNIDPIMRVFCLFFKKCLKTEFTEDNDKSTVKDMSDSNIEQNNLSKLTVDILNSVLKALSSVDTQHQVLCLDCLIYGLPCLKNDENLLLRTCYLIWNPLVEKFRTKNSVVLFRCFKLLLLLSSLAKDFIRQRTLE